jgi:hypothetical protein
MQDIIAEFANDYIIPSGANQEVVVLISLASRLHQYEVQGQHSDSQKVHPHP